MGHQSIRELTAALDRQLLSADRFLPALLEIRSHEDETLFVVGGCWDTIARCYVDRPCEPHVVRLKKSQLEIGHAIGKYIAQRRAGDDARAALMMAIGNRGGGKTFVCGGVLMLAIALAFPGRWQIGISITSKQNRELKTAIEMVARPEWIAQDVTDPRDPHTDFITGSTILWLTARNPKALRQALLPFELVLINEGQDQAEVVFTNAIHAVRSGGMVAVATNPPQEDGGDWVAVLYNGIQADPTDGIAYVLDNKDNDAVSQSTLGKIGRLLRMVNPEAAAADSDGVIKLSGLAGYQGMTKLPRKVDADGRWLSGHIGNPDPEWEDVTRELTAQLTKSEDGTDYVAGGDFQTEPGSCAPVGKIYRLPTSDLLLWIREFVTTTGTEEDLTRSLTACGYFPGPVNWDGEPAPSLLLVGDATGARQNAEHRKRDPYSFSRLRGDGWTVLPPDLYGPKRTPWNPLISDSRKQMKMLAHKGLILLSPECLEASDGFPALAESFVRAKVTREGKFVKKGHHTHGPDGVRYLAWRFLARPRVLPPPTDLETADRVRSIRVWSSD